VQGVYTLFSADELRPLATIDGAALTLLRTAAVSALAARLLAPPTASRLVLFGAGPQAHAHLEAMAAVRPLRSVSVVSRGLERARILVESARRRGLDASLGSPADVAGSELVCTCTTSPTPVFDGSLVAPGSHVSAVGAYTPQTRELDEQLVSRATVVVETREAALAEAGDLLMPIASGSLTADRVHELADVVTGRVGRRATHEVTLFKSVGVAFEDLAVAEAAYSRSR
jgi:ornithine cyclodeaminase/alanine dehydrogenase-like protein (mu-crystallin family)